MATEFKSAVKENVGSNPVDALVATDPCTVFSGTVANVTDHQVSATVWLVKADGSKARIVSNAPIAAGGSLIFAGGNVKHCAEQGDKIRVQMSEDNAGDVTMSYLQKTSGV